MPRKPISFELDFMVKDILPKFTVKQLDDVSFNIKPKNQGLDYDVTGMTAKIYIGVNNEMFMQTDSIIVSSDNINILLNKNILQKNGRAYAEIELTDKNGTISSSTFIFNIDAKVGEGGIIPDGFEGFVSKYEKLISEFKAQINDMNNKADKTELHEHNNKSVLDSITEENISNWNNKAGFDGNYDNLTNKPTIPTKVSQLTNDKNYLTNVPSEYITETELNQKGYSTFSGNYNDLINKPTIPTITNDLTNTLKTNYDKAYTHSQEVHAPGDAQKNSDITKAEIEAKLTGNITTHTHSQYLTEHQDISHLALKSELHNHSNKSVLDGITSSKVTEWNNKSTFSGNYNDLTNKPTVPTKTSQLNNDSNYLTSIPSEYVTESELIAKGYATQTELNNKLNKNFGSENVGKILAVGSDGNVALMDMPNSDIGGDIAGFVDGDNNIILMGALPNGTYVLKYENIDGTYTNIGDLVVGTIASPEPEPTFTNLAEYNATNTSDFTIWCNDSRMGSDGSYRQLLGYATTNYIEVKKGDVIRVKGFNYETQKYPTMCVMDSSKTNLYNSYYLEMLKSHGFISDVTESESYAEFTIGSATIGDNIAYIRIAGKPTNGGENVIITKNEEII